MLRRDFLFWPGSIDTLSCKLLAVANSLLANSLESAAAFQYSWLERSNNMKNKTLEHSLGQYQVGAKPPQHIPKETMLAIQSARPSKKLQKLTCQVRALGIIRREKLAI
jgi:hypothetical protein